MKITFGEWLPDQPGVTGAVTDAVNCYPVSNGYAPIRDAADYSDAAGETLLVAFADNVGDASVFWLDFDYLNALKIHLTLKLSKILLW